MMTTACMHDRPITFNVVSDQRLNFAQRCACACTYWAQISVLEAVASLL